MSTGDRSPSSSGTETRRPAAISDRQLPHHPEAEKSVIGSILLLPEVFDEVALLLRPADFYDEANRTIYEQLLAMHDDGLQIDVMVLIERLRKAEKFEACGGAAYLAEIGQQVSTAAHAEYYAKIVTEKSTLRSLILAGTDILHDAYDVTSEPREMLSRAEEKIFGILESRGTGEVSAVGDVLQDAMDRLDARMENHHAYAGLETGFEDYDQLTGGLQNSELTILAARPSMGKTALAMNIAEHIVLQLQVPVLFVSLEMSSLELVDRLLCSVPR